MSNEAIFVTDEAWHLLRKHFTMNEGLFDQIEQGRIVEIRMGDQPERSTELEEIQQALKDIRQSWTTMQQLPKWQVCLLWSVAPQIDAMLQRFPKNALMLHILQAKLFTWFEQTLIDFEQEQMQEYLLVNDITTQMSETKNFSMELRIGRIDQAAFEQLVQAIMVLRTTWRGQTTLPRLAAWLFILVPLQSWNASGRSKEQKGHISAMKLQLYSLIEACLCD